MCSSLDRRSRKPGVAAFRGKHPARRSRLSRQAPRSARLSARCSRFYRQAPRSAQRRNKRRRNRAWCSRSGASFSLGAAAASAQLRTQQIKLCSPAQPPVRLAGFFFATICPAQPPAKIISTQHSHQSEIFVPDAAANLAEKLPFATQPLAWRFYFAQAAFSPGAAAGTAQTHTLRKRVLAGCRQTPDHSRRSIRATI